MIYNVTKKGVHLKFQRLFFDKLAKKLNISSHEEWYLISKTLVNQNGGRKILRKYEHSLGKALSAIYPGILISS